MSKITEINKCQKNGGKIGALCEKKTEVHFQFTNDLEKIVVKTHSLHEEVRNVFEHIPVRSYAPVRKTTSSNEDTISEVS